MSHQTGHIGWSPDYKSQPLTPSMIKLAKFAKADIESDPWRLAQKYASELQALADIIIGGKNVTAPFREVKERLEEIMSRERVIEGLKGEVVRALETEQP